MRLLIFILILSLNTLIDLKAQEINFGTDYSSIYAVTVSELFMGTELDFGTVLAGEGTVSQNIFNSKVLTIEGVSYLDVFVTISVDNGGYLIQDGNPGCVVDSCRIPFTLEAAYYNRGDSSTPGSANTMTVLGNSSNAQFPIRYRTSNAPGPPPTPVYSGYDPSVFNKTAFLYIYGSIDVQSIVSDSYSGTVTVTVTYD